MNLSKLTSGQSRFFLQCQGLIMGLQMLFVAFGALILVPLITGLNPSTALLTAGLGTLVFQAITHRSIPIFLASSFAFIGPILYSKEVWGEPITLGSLVACGSIYVLLSLLVKYKGADSVIRWFPAVVVGPLIMVIGLGMAPVAIQLAMGKSATSSEAIVEPHLALMISGTVLAITLISSVFAKGFMRLFSILLGISIGYLLAWWLGLVDFSGTSSAPWFAFPPITLPQFRFEAILFMLPVTMAPVIEHIGDLSAISAITGKDYFKDPGLSKTLLGDGLATSVAACLGGPPNTTYSEVTGALILTRNFSPVILTWSAVWALCMAFVGKLGAILLSIPSVVMGGIMTLLFGMIAVLGIQTLINGQVNLNHPRNLCIISVVLVVGIGKLDLQLGPYSLEGISVSAIVGILLNAILPKEKPLKV